MVFNAFTNAEVIRDMTICSERCPKTQSNIVESAIRNIKIWQWLLLFHCVLFPLRYPFMKITYVFYVFDYDLWALNWES